MNKWKIFCAFLSIILLFVAFFLLNSEESFRNDQRDKRRIEGFLSHYFLLNSEIMGVKINDLECETENMYAGGFIASDSGGLYVIRTSEYFKELNTQPIPAIQKNI